MSESDYQFDCSRCGGTGKVLFRIPGMQNAHEPPSKVDCSTCKGSGKQPTELGKIFLAFLDNHYARKKP